MNQLAPTPHRLAAAVALVILTFGLSPAPAAEGPEKPAVQKESWVCPPCPVDCHDRTYDGPGSCEVCGMTLVKKSRILKVAIVLWNGVELLDFSGPGEVFAASNKSDGTGAFQVYTVASSTEPITSQGFLSVNPRYSFEDCPAPDVIVLPGGGTRNALDDGALLEWVNRSALDADHVLSVCTGAFILARVGALKGRAATTWHGAIESLRRAAPETEVLADKRVVDNGKFITTAGVSAGIDGALYLVGKMMGIEAARNAARYMEYDWRPDELPVHVAPPREEPEKDAANRSARIRDRADGSTATIASSEEPGTRLSIAGRIVDSGTGAPVADAAVYLYHTGTDGRYSPTDDSSNPRLFANLVTDAEGRFHVETIRPGSYPGTRNPAHVHYEVAAPGFRRHVAEFLFEDDPLIDEGTRKWANDARFPILAPEKDGKGGQRVAVTLRLTR